MTGNAAHTTRNTQRGHQNAHWCCRTPSHRHGKGLVDLELFKLPPNKSLQVKSQYAEVGILQWARHTCLQWNIDHGTSVGLPAPGGTVHYGRLCQDHTLCHIIHPTLEKPMVVMKVLKKKTSYNVEMHTHYVICTNLFWLLLETELKWTQNLNLHSLGWEKKSDILCQNSTTPYAFLI